MTAKSKHRFNLPIISILVLLIGFFFRSLSARGEQHPAGGDDRPNILLVMADDWSWPHARAYGDGLVKTPTFDRIASKGILFTHAFCPAPSCTPSRLSILTGQYPHRLNEGANHMVKFPKNYDVYPELLEKAGYHVGKYGKGANFGSMEGTGWKHDPAGRDFGNFRNSSIRTFTENRFVSGTAARAPTGPSQRFLPTGV
jgi:arylsulfatase A-like enzyme